MFRLIATPEENKKEKDPGLETLNKWLANMEALSKGAEVKEGFDDICEKDVTLFMTWTNQERTLDSVLPFFKTFAKKIDWKRLRSKEPPLEKSGELSSFDRFCELPIINNGKRETDTVYFTFSQRMTKLKSFTFSTKFRG